VSACSSGGSSPSSSSTPTAGPTPTAGSSAPAGSPSAGSPSASSVNGSQLKICYAVDVGGIADHGFYQNGYDGLVQAQQQYGVSFTYLTATGAQDYAPMINTFITQGTCSIILAIGSVFSDTVQAAAKAHPDQKFIMLDAAFTDAAGNQITYPNVDNITFRDEQNSFLAGYVAAGMTKTGVIGVWAGLNIVPTVKHFYGFQAAIQLYNERHNTQVKLIGWDSKTGQGTFTGSFSDQQGGRRVSEQQIGAGADILFSCGGQASLGELAAAQAHPGVSVIWVDTSITDDPTLKDKYGSLQITSTMKRLDNAILDVVKKTLAGNFPAGINPGNLETGALALAPFRSDVPASLSGEVDQLKADVISGKIIVPQNPGLPGPTMTGLPPMQ
jgi:basic membrane protein A